jgi:uncharacterized protein
MKVLITGATGLVGSALAAHLRSSGATVDALRRPHDWNPETGYIDCGRLEGVDAVIHLAGENIAAGRWTELRKQKILDSRVRGTDLLARSLASVKRPPKVFISASAIGYYGDRGSTILDESSPAGSGFLAEVCKKWEAATSPAAIAGIRVVQLRTGIVLSRDGGALPQMARPFRFGAGGVLGDGRQFMSWITLQDLCRAFHHVLVTESLRGAVNAVSPEPSTNREFTQALASALHRPALVCVPRFAVRLALGELADALMLASTRVIPANLLQSGFSFEDSDIRIALAKTLSTVTTFHQSQWIARPIEDVFPFFANANNLEQITPPWLRFEILNPNVTMGRGALIDYKLHLHGIPLHWQSEIVEWDPPRRFIDVQRRGPYTLWIHEHRFEALDGGTRVHDVVQYAAPGGELVRKIMIGRDIDSIFNYRKMQLEKHFA